MALATPQFWKSRSFLSYVLWPLSVIYRLASCLRNLFIRPANVTFKTICIGNITVGGAGKTPVALAVGKLLNELSTPYSYLSKGYGGTIEAPTTVMLNHHTAEQVGDEPLLLAKQAPTIISKNWKVGAETIDHYTDIVIMDDGLQNPGIAKDLSLLVINGAYGLGNGKILPAGPLRETLASALKRVDAVIIVGDDAHGLSDYIHAPIINTTLTSRLPEALKGKPIIAFAGIANPEKFFSSLTEHPCTLIDTHAFADHHLFTNEELNTLILKAHHANAALVTTEKDFARIDASYHSMIHTIPATIEWDYKQEILSLLHAKIIDAS